MNFLSKNIYNMNKILKKIYKKIKKIKRGKNASYIPELARVNPNIFSISFVDCNGHIYHIGNHNKKVAIESISKLFTFSKVIKTIGQKKFMTKVGLDGSSLPFNSVAAEELSPSHTINPFVNQGAIATTSLLYKKNKKQFQKTILDNMNLFANRKLIVGQDVYRSESKTNVKNIALAQLLKSHNRFYGDVLTTVDVYTKQCSVLVSSDDLAIMGSVFANGGIHPITNKRILQSNDVEFILNALGPEGLYEYSDNWMMRTKGVPAKSGVGGGILMVMPGIGAFGIVSPPLDLNGNSVKGIESGVLLAKETRKLYNIKNNFDCKTRKKGRKRRKTKKNRKLKK